MDGCENPVRVGRVVGAALAGLIAVVVCATPCAAAVTGPVTLPPVGRKCQDPGEASRETPWYQRAYSPQRIAPLSTGRGVTVAVIDSGVDASHPQLAGRVLPGQDLLYPGGGPGNWDCVGHGTAVASIIAGGGEPGAAFRGYAPGASVLPFVVSEQDADKGGGAPVTAESFAAAIRTAVAQRVGVINLSVVIYDDHPSVRSAVAEAVDSDVVVVAAAGNLETGTPFAGRTPYPAGYPGVIGVGAVDRAGQRLASSAIGPWVDLMAPGEELVAATRASGYRSYSGTSFATPVVSAAAALIRSREPALSAEEVAARLFATAGPAVGARPGASASVEYGRGIIDPYRAVAEYPAAAPREPRTLPPYGGEEADPVRARQVEIAVTTAILIIVVALLASAGAVAAARGRRRRWMPGRAVPPRRRVAAESNRRLFDDLED